MNIVLVSTFEGGLQPLSLATAGAHLLRAGHSVTAVDLSVEELSDALLQSAQLVAFSVPLFESLEPSVDLATSLTKRSDALSLFFGTYAMLNCDALLDRCADGVVMGDWERVLVEAAARREEGKPLEGLLGLAT